MYEPILFCLILHFLEFDPQLLVLCQQQVSFAGNLVKNCGEEDNEVQIPYSAEGTMHMRSSSKLFVKTVEQLPMGMCGGPVINKQGYCIGMTEGVVNPIRNIENHPERARLLSLSGCAACISAADLVAFINEVEELHKLEAETVLF